MTPLPPLRLKLTHKVMLVLSSPLIVVLFLLSLLFVQLKELEHDNELAAKTMKVMSTIDHMLYDSINLMTAYFAFLQSNNDLALWNRFKALLSQMIEDRNSVRALAVDAPGTGEEIRHLVTLMDQVFDTIEESRSHKSLDYQESSLLRTTLFRQLSDVNEAGQRLIEKQNALRESYVEHNIETSSRLRTLVEILAASSIVTAGAALVILGQTFNRRLQLLMSNTINIARDAPLQSVGGNDELSALDQTIHRLSGDLAASRRSERALIDNTAEIIWSLDSRGRITQVNQAIDKILATSAREALGSLVQRFVLEEDRKATFEMLERCQRSDAECSFECRLRRLDGRVIDTNWVVRWSGTDSSYFCVVHDISERKDAERLRQEVVAMVSHDLRSPLMSLSITIEMLLQGVLGNLNEKGHDVLMKSRQSALFLMEMINDLLEAEKLQAGAGVLCCEIINTRRLMEEAVAMLASEAEQKEITVVVRGADLEVGLDGERIRRVIINFLGNAIKFSPNDSIINLRSSVNEHDGFKWLELSVSDQGPGIPADKVALIFERFKQAGSGHKGEKSGSGLGLAICKAIVEAHRGRIGVNTKEGEGSTFWCQIPIGPA